MSYVSCYFGNFSVVQLLSFDNDVCLYTCEAIIFIISSSSSFYLLTMMSPYMPTKILCPVLVSILIISATSSLLSVDNDVSVYTYQNFMSCIS